MSTISIARSAPVKIGLCVLREGRAAFYGTGVYEAASLAVEELPPIHGHKIQLVVRDDVVDRGQMWRAVADFVAEDVVAVVGPMTFGSARLAIPPLETAGICAVLPSARNPDLTRLGFTNVFRVDFDAGAQAVVQAEYAHAQLQARRVVIVHDTSAFWTGVARVFELLYERFDRTEVRRVPFELPLDAGGRTLKWLTKLLTSWTDVDLLYAASNGPELATLLQGLREAGNRAPFLACAALGSDDLREVPDIALRDVYATTPTPPAGNYSDFASRFQNMFGHEPGYYSPEAFDAVTVVCRAVHEVAVDKEGMLEIDRTSLLQALRRGRFNGVTGDIEFGSSGERLNQGRIVVGPITPPSAGSQRPIVNQTGLPRAALGAEGRPSRGTEQPPAQRGVELFYSYSSADENLRKELEKHLVILKRQGAITGWHFRKIVAGEEWERKIDEHLNSAKVILLLITADFLYSEYCYDVETKRALQRHDAGEARVIPVILRACDWNHPPLSKLQALPTGAIPITSWSNADEAFTNVAKGIRAAVAEMSGEL